MNVLPLDIQKQWPGSQLVPATPTAAGVYRLIDIQPTRPKSYQELRIIVQVVDENGLPLSGVPVAFSYDTARSYFVDPAFAWSPPHPWQADVVPTTGAGEIEHIQGSVIKQGDVGGITAYILDPDHSSDVVAHIGALADHTGLRLKYQLRRAGVLTLEERFKRIEDRLNVLEQG